MKLESLQLGKFKDNVLKKEQMFMLNGGGIATGGGNITGTQNGRAANYNYGYDAYRNGTLTFHNRTDIKYLAVQVFPDETLPTATADDDFSPLHP
jgi:natural product precursor